DCPGGLPRRVVELAVHDNRPGSPLHLISGNSLRPGPRKQRGNHKCSHGPPLYNKVRYHEEDYEADLPTWCARHMRRLPMVTRRSAIAALAGAASVRGKSGRKPNLLYLIADDHAGYVLGADGNKLARTPNLDRLAAEGTRFAMNHCNSPV